MIFVLQYIAPLILSVFYVQSNVFSVIGLKLILSNMNIKKEDINNEDATTFVEFHGFTSEVLWLLVHILSI